MRNENLIALEYTCARDVGDQLNSRSYIDDPLLDKDVFAHVSAISFPKFVRLSNIYTLDIVRQNQNKTKRVHCNRQEVFSFCEK